MNIFATEDQDGKILNIKIRGRFEFSHHHQFREAYAKTNPESTKFVIDLSETSYMDSAALGMLLVLRERAGGNNSDITLSGCNQEVQKILEITNFHNLFKIKGSQIN